MKLPIFVLPILMLCGSIASAQTDRLHPVGGDMVLGKIKEVTKNGIVMTVGGKDQTFAAGTIEKVTYQGDPSGLATGRDFAIAGQYDQAMEDLRGVNVDDLSRDVVKADAAYYRMLTQSKLALAGKGDLKAAAASALDFARNHSDSWRFYDAAKLLGDLAMATGNFDQAGRYYGSLRGAPSMEMKIESVYQTAMVNLGQGNLDAAEKEFGQIVGLGSLTSTGALKLKNLSTVGLAVVKARQGKTDEAIKMTDDLIVKLTPTDVELAAMIYNARGAAYESKGNDEDAILAYLHTHLMFSADAGAHVTSLKRLVDLWTKVGKLDRAAEARGELQQRYPGLSG